MRVKYVVLSCITTAVCLILLMLVFQASLAMSASSQLASTAGWIDEFDSPTLDSRWEWLREDPTHWSLTERTGFLRIVTQEGSLFMSGTGKNILLTKPTLDNYQISTKVDFAPTELAQCSGLVVYQDDDNYIQLSRRFTSSDYVTFRFEVGENVFSTNITVTATTLYLRITKFYDGYVGEYSIDGDTWIEVDKYNVEFTDSRIGLTAHNGPSTTDIPSDFDFFQLSTVGTTLYVAPGAECGEANPCYSTIQQAVDAADLYDTIKVAAGTYDDLNVRPRDDITATGVVTQVVYLTKSLNLQGGYSPLDWNTPDPQTNPTTLDAQGQGRVIYVAGDINLSIQGFTITGGDAAGLGGWEKHESDDRDCGGGIYVISATTTISDCLINHNQALDGHGGGVFLAGVGTGVAHNNIFHSNQAQSGGGIALREAWFTVVNNNFRENTATGSGGGLAVFGSPPDLINNLVIGNHSDGSGGGIYLQMFGGTLDSNLIISNTANHDGGGISVLGVGRWTNNVLIDNYANGRGSALFITPGGPELVHTTLARNHGGDGSAIYITEGGDPEWRTSVELINTVFVSHTIGISITAGHTVTVDGILWQDVPIRLSAEPGSYTTIDNEFTGDPAFAADGYHLTAGSAAIDKGLDAGVAIDFDGEPRPSGTGYDLGADELWIKLYLPSVQNK